MLHMPTGGQQVTPRPFWATQEAKPASLESETTHLQVLREEGPQLRLQQLPVGGGERRMRGDGVRGLMAPAWGGGWDLGWGPHGQWDTADVRGGHIHTTQGCGGLGWPCTFTVHSGGSRFIIPAPHFTQEEAEGGPGKGGK